MLRGSCNNTPLRHTWFSVMKASMPIAHHTHSHQEFVWMPPTLNAKLGCTPTGLRYSLKRESLCLTFCKNLSRNCANCSTPFGADCTWQSKQQLSHNTMPCGTWCVVVGHTTGWVNHTSCITYSVVPSEPGLHACLCSPLKSSSIR